MDFDIQPQEYRRKDISQAQASGDSPVKFPKPIGTQTTARKSQYTSIYARKRCKNRKAALLRRSRLLRSKLYKKINRNMKQA